MISETLTSALGAAAGADGDEAAAGANGAVIDRVETLRTYLQWAIELEHFTIPPYLCALYSLDSRRNPDAVEVVRTVVIEEMLHMTLAVNLLNAVGGRPQVDVPQMLPGYPGCLPHSNQAFEVPLMGFCPEALDVFLQIEQPTAAAGTPSADGYATIGEFYDAIEQGLRSLCAQHGEAAVFTGDPSRQVTNELYSGAGGRVIVINDLASALDALAEIVEQGEGAEQVDIWDRSCNLDDPTCRELAHYYRFEELKLGRRYLPGDTPADGPTGDTVTVDWDGVRRMRSNPRRADSPPGSAIRTAQDDFASAYCEVLALLDEAFDGMPHVLQFAIGAMYGLGDLADALMQMPLPGGDGMAGPTFEYIPAGERSRKFRPNPPEA